MIKKYKSMIFKGLLAMLAPFALSSCNNMGSSISSPTSFNDKEVSIQTVAMDTQWSLDGAPIEMGYNLRDMAWHLLTVTVVDMQQPLESAVAVNGLLYQIYPAPKDNRGEKIELEDINCKIAMFSKNGDSCSVYVRIFYDTATGTSNPPTIPAQFITNAPQLDAFITINDKAVFDYPQGDYRVVSPTESRYYRGVSLASNPIQYQILSMQNIGNMPLTITKISDVTNPTFTLLNRTTFESIDPIYGPYSQCALTADVNVNQVNLLPSLGSECIIVYKAAPIGSQTIESDSITLETNAKTTAPWTINTLQLTAIYGTLTDQITLGKDFVFASGSGVTSGNAMLMSSDGTLSSNVINTGESFFEAVSISYDFKPKPIALAPYGLPFYQDGIINIADQGSSIVIGEQILTDASSTNPITIGTIKELITPGSDAYYSANLSYPGETCKSETTISNSVILVNQGLLHIHATTNDGLLIKQHDFDVPIGGYIEEQLASNSSTICSIKLYGGQCNGDDCAYTLYHYTVDHYTGEDIPYGSYQLNFKRPQVYTELSNLTNFIPNAIILPNILGKFSQNGQNLTAILGTQSSVVTQSIQCMLNLPEVNQPGCRANGLYVSESGVNNVSYNIGLNSGDILYQGVISFTSNNGYNLADFTISH